MALHMCKACKKAFISSQYEEEVCPDCDARIRELYTSVRNFLRNNDAEVYTAQDVSRIMGIALGDVVAMISMGLVEFRINREAVDGSKGYVHTHIRKKKRRARGEGKR